MQRSVDICYASSCFKSSWAEDCAFEFLRRTKAQERGRRGIWKGGKSENPHTDLIFPPKYQTTSASALHFTLLVQYCELTIYGLPSLLTQHAHLSALLPCCLFSSKLHTQHHKLNTIFSIRRSFAVSPISTTHIILSHHRMLITPEFTNKIIGGNLHARSGIPDRVRVFLHPAPKAISLRSHHNHPLSTLDPLWDNSWILEPCHS